MPKPEASAEPLHLLRFPETKSPWKECGQPGGPGQEGREPETDTMEKPVQRVQKLLPRVEEDAQQEAARRECRWRAWVQVRTPSWGGRGCPGPWSTSVCP